MATLGTKTYRQSLSAPGEHFLAVKIFKVLARKADGVRFSPYGRIIFSLLSKREKKDRILGYVCIYNFFKNDSKKSDVWSRNKKTANGECLSWYYECVYCFALSFTHIKLIAHK